MAKKAMGPLAGIRLLLAEDNNISLEFFYTVLQRAGADVTTTKDGLQALHATRKQAFDILVFDLQMPFMTGTELADAIRGETANPNYKTPMVALTAHLQSDHFEEVLAHGFDRCQTKPITKNSLIELIQNTMSGTREGAITRNEAGGVEAMVWDRSAALTVTGGDEQVAVNMLELLVARLADQCTQLDKLIHASAFEDAGKVVHKLHGSARFCACGQLTDTARHMENALISGDSRAITQAMPALEQAAQALIAQYRIIAAKRE